MTDNMLFEMEPMRYWSLPSGLSPQEQREKIENRLLTNNYIWSQKTDGNWSRAVITPSRSALQTRGISKTTGTYGEVQDNVFWWEDVVNAFSDTTVLLGEIYIPGGIDKNVGSCLRAKSLKSKCIQSAQFYEEARKTTKFTAKDKRDIEQNEFFNVPLHWRIFDVLYYEGKCLMDDGIEVRSTYIEKAIKQINNPLVHGVKYFPANCETFFDEVSKIWQKGGEGAVLYREGVPYVPGKRGPSAWDTMKVKQTLAEEADVFITGVEPAVRAYTGKDVTSWVYWENVKTGEKLYGNYYTEYRDGVQNLEPISKGWFNDWPGAIICSVYDENHNFYEICRVAGLTEEMKEDLKNNFETNWYLRPVKISAMMVSQDKNGTSFSMRHPVIKSFRDNDISIDDCTLSKILGARS